MDELALNQKLASGEINEIGVFPHLDRLVDMTYVFDIDFGLGDLPTEPGILLIRGARQYGKSTWLEQSLKQTIQTFGAGTAFYLNGDFILTIETLEKSIEVLLMAFRKDAPIKRIFIDEITAIPNWEIALKRLADTGKIKDVLIVTTGSTATDLRRGVERLPGRKRRLARTDYLFTPVSYRAFHQACGKQLKDKSLTAYLLSGGSPIACNELAANQVLPEYILTLTRDWIDGEIARSGRSRASVYELIKTMFKFGGTPVGQMKLARETGLANNTVAQGFVEILNDLAVVTSSYPWDVDKQVKIMRKPCKYHLTNLLAALAFNPQQIRSLDDFIALPAVEQGLWYEWLVAQELLRRSAIKGDNILSPQAFWQNNQHEIDFVMSNDHFVEVKRGGCSALEFAWFVKQFPKKKLTVVNANSFETDQVRGVTFEQFLLDDELN